ncbi:MAG: MTH1187 family thiamine-binding protein [Chloroflexi bacterium]|nr:MTH1187 family thiamine-binding protein [Chloroflexota bacterium]
MAVAEVSIEPIGTCSTSVSDLITACVGVLEKQTDVKWDVTAMGTILEGDRARILSLVGQMDDACVKAGAPRVLTNLRIDERSDKVLHMDEMESEVESQFGRA